jgi:outer membrane protein assembly factor BamB
MFSSMVPPSASAEVAVGAGLEPAFAFFSDYDQAQGAGLVAALDAATVQVNWSRGRAPGGQPTAFLPRGGAVINGGTIFIDSGYADATGEALAALLAHESRHAVDLIQAGRALDPTACMESEIRAHQEQAHAWAYLTSPTGREAAESPLEQDLNDLLAASQQGPQSIQDWIVARGLSRC